MIVDFRTTKTPSNYVNKVFTFSLELDGKFRNPADIVNPVITIQGRGWFQGNDINLLDCNYAYIRDLKRYYFITDWVVDSNWFATCSMHCDVLSTFWNRGLSDSRCIAGRSSSAFQTDLVDDELWFTADSLYSIYDFPQAPFSQAVGRNYVMLVAGSD